jgi:large subunit ribosomal protein L35
MPKLKTVKGVKERIKVTGTGKLLARRAGRRHLLAHRRAKTMRQLRRSQVVAAADARRIAALLPYDA